MPPDVTVICSSFCQACQSPYALVRVDDSGAALKRCKCGEAMERFERALESDEELESEQ